MKKICITILSVAFVFSGKASIILPGKNPLASEVMIPLFGSDKLISLEDFSVLTPQKYKAITGKRLNIGNRIKLLISKNYSKRLIQKDGRVDMDKIQRKFGFFDRWHWHWGGFALGFLLILGPIIALFFNDEYKWDRFWTALVVCGALAGALAALASAGL